MEPSADYIDPIWSLQTDNYIVLLSKNNKCYLLEGHDIQTKDDILKITIENSIYRFACDYDGIFKNINYGVLDLTHFKVIDVQPII